MNQSTDNSIGENAAPSPQVRVPVKALAESLCHYLALDQRVLLRLLSRSVSGELSDSQFVALLENFSLELPRRKQVAIKQIADRIESGESFINALSAYNSTKRKRATNFCLMEQALRTAEQQNSSLEFLEAISQYQPSQRPMALRYQDTLRKKLTRLGFKTFIIFQLVVFLILYIVPEFLKIFYEYEIELPWLMQLFIAVSRQVSRYYLLLFLLACLVAIYLLFKFRHVFLRVISKFSPWSWLNAPLAKRHQQKLSFAISGGQSTDSNADVKQLKRPTFRKNESSALKIVDSADAKSWLLSRIAQQGDQRNAVWKNRLGDSFILFWNLVLACVVAVVTFSIISSLIAIVKGFSES